MTRAHLSPQFDSEPYTHDPPTQSDSQTAMDEHPGVVSAQPFVSHDVMAHRSNAQVRALSLRRAQQTYGNRYVQRMISVQRQTADGAKSAKYPGNLPSKGQEVEDKTIPLDMNEFSALIHKAAIEAMKRADAIVASDFSKPDEAGKNKKAQNEQNNEPKKADPQVPNQSASRSAGEPKKQWEWFNQDPKTKGVHFDLQATAMKNESPGRLRPFFSFEPQLTVLPFTKDWSLLKYTPSEWLEISLFPHEPSFAITKSVHVKDPSERKSVLIHTEVSAQADALNIGLKRGSKDFLELKGSFVYQRDFTSGSGQVQFSAGGEYHLIGDKLSIIFQIQIPLTSGLPSYGPGVLGHF
jgi:hypothetical protein